ncbi:CD276 antigen-like [Notolabrus celidotus]|uniref:CD276 antigen-like n=1 Tax=Notolabrus celidotus TaxID=1203425 RepID=UPI0014903A4B|nr:CD276 antigen-like [Notolabrus celidotus]
MTVDRYSLVLVVLILPWTFDKGDAEVCTFMETCILPCTYAQGDQVVIHWIQGDKTAVHSYYRDRDQLERQNPSFRGRTGLFKDQISKGNASLKLTAVTPGDQGRYKCYVSTITGNKEFIVELIVSAPPREVILQQEENRISCSSEGIYPEPKLNWTSSPPTALQPDTPTVLQTEQKLFSIKSSLLVPDGGRDFDYSCTVTAGRSKNRATLYRPDSLPSSGSEVTIPCTSSNILQQSVIWRFNHTQNILTWTDASSKVSEEWTKYVKNVSESGSLMLQALTPNQEGTYTCELRTAEEIHIKSTVLTVEESPGSSTAGIAVGVIAAILIVVVAVGVGVYYFVFRKGICKKETRSSEEEKDTKEMQFLNSNGNGSAVNFKVEP